MLPRLGECRKVKVWKNMDKWTSVGTPWNTEVCESGSESRVSLLSPWIGEAKHEKVECCILCNLLY